MAQITFLGGPETGNVGSVEWGRFTFVLNKAVECDDQFIIGKARKNRFFQVGSDMIQADVEDIEVVEDKPALAATLPPRTSDDGPTEASKPPLPQRDPMPRRRGRPPKVASNG